MQINTPHSGEGQPISGQRVIFQRAADKSDTSSPSPPTLAAPARGCRRVTTSTGRTARRQHLSQSLGVGGGGRETERSPVKQTP